MWWLGVWRWSRSAKKHLEEWQNLPAPRIDGVDVEIIRCDLISDILSPHFWMNWWRPQKDPITTAIYKPRFELSTTRLRCKNSNYASTSFGFILHLPFITIIIIIIIIVVVIIIIIIIIIVIIKVADCFTTCLESWLAIYVCGKQISAVYVTRMLNIVFSKAHY